jgi:nucleoside-diphosphate-sugar epimerase
MRLGFRAGARVARSYPGKKEENTVIHSEQELEDLLSAPAPAVLAAMQGLESDLLVLGVGGKMGPTLARMAARALQEIASPYKVIGVARFSQPALREKLEVWGIETIACDLLDARALAALPDSRNLIFMAGQKFGTTGAEDVTWAMNTGLPMLVCERYHQGRAVVFSTGNVYPLTPVVQGGALESDSTGAVGEYANSCLGRERVFEYYSRRRGLRCAVMRLNYAIDMRYGVLLDIGSKVHAGRAVDLSMGAVNVIWQGDANAQALALLDHCAAPPFILNVTGPETASVRQLAHLFGEIFGVEPEFTGFETDTALLSNASRAQQLFGYPTVALRQLVEWTAAWIEQGGATLNKPTSFEVRDGRF